MTEYPFPKSNMVEGLSERQGLLSFSTPPPTLRKLFLVVLEMASWINLSDHERNIILMHQPDLHSSNPSMALACLIALMNRALFVDGTTEVLPFI